MTSNRAGAQNGGGKEFWPSTSQVMSGVSPGAPTAGGPHVYQRETLSFVSDGPCFGRMIQ